MPVHHRLPDSCSLSSGAKAAGHTQRTVTPPSLHWPGPSSSPPGLPVVTSWGPEGPLGHLCCQNIYISNSLAKVTVRFSVALFRENFNY